MSAASNLYPWAPTTDEVARLSPSYTEGGFEDDNPTPGEQGAFTESTSPTAREVEDLILAACDEVAGRVGTAIPARCYTLARTTAKWYVAANIAGDKASGSDDAGGEYRSKILNYRNSLDALVEQARMPSAMRLR